MTSGSHATSPWNPVSKDDPAHPGSSFFTPIPAPPLSLHRILFHIALFLALLFPASSTFAASIRASLDRDTIAVGETAVINLVIENANPRAHPSFISPPGLKILPGGQSTQVRIINGDRRTQLTLTYSVEASKVGDFIIRSADVNTDAGLLKTPELRLTVTRATAKPVGEGPASLRISPKKERVVVGEIIPVDILLYVAEGRLLQMPQLTAEGFTLGKILEPTQSRVRVNGRELNLVTFKTTATAVKTGPLTLGPISMPLEVPVQGNRADSFFFRPSQQIKVTADAVTIQSDPLPPNAPPDFHGGIGLFSMECSASPTQLTAGDPITMRIQISGTGNIENLSLHPLDSWQGFKIYPPTSRLVTEDPLVLSGTKVFEQVLVPQSHDLQEIPALRWSYFDPDQKAYRTLECKKVAITLAPAHSGVATLPGGNPGAPGGIRLSQGAETNGLRHIKPQLGALVSPSSLTPTASTYAPWILQGIPFTAWLLLRLRRWQNEKLAQNPALLRRRSLEKAIDRDLQHLRTLAQSTDRNAFFDRMSTLLQRAIAARFDIPESGVTEGVIEERIRPEGWPVEQIRDLETLFQVCNQARYAPGAISTPLPQLLSQVENCVRNLLSRR